MEKGEEDQGEVSVRALCEEFWQFRLRHRPGFAIFKGLLPAAPALDSYATESFSERKAFCEMLVEKVKRVDLASLKDPTDALSLQLLQYYANTVLQYDKYQQHLMPFQIFEGPDEDFRRYMLPKLPFRTEADYEYYIELVKCFAKQMREVETVMREGMEKSLVCHQVSLVPAAVLRVAELSKAAPEDTPFFSPFSLFPPNMPTHTRSALAEKGRVVIREFAQKACAHFHDFLVQHYVPALRADVSISSVPGPAGRYEAMLKYNCDTDAPPRDLHAIGLRVMRDNLQRMHKVLENVGFSGSIQEFSEYMKTQKDHWFKNNDEAVDYCRYYIEKVIKPKLSSCFYPLERDHPLEIGVDENNKSATKAIYINPSADGTVPGRVLLEPQFAAHVPKYEIPVLLLHEAWPGHHMQASYILDKPGRLPEFRLHKDERMYSLNPANFPMNVAYTEGWGLYCEGLGEDFGLYDDPLDEFGYLLHDSMRCCRVVVDTGIHALGWSREQAIEYMRAHTGLSDVHIECEVDRYITVPAQACAYKLGQVRLTSLRDKCRAALGREFCLREFHDICLSPGQVPLDLLEGLVDTYIGHKRKRITTATQAP